MSLTFSFLHYTPFASVHDKAYDVLLSRNSYWICSCVYLYKAIAFVLYQVFTASIRNFTEYNQEVYFPSDF